MPELPEVETVCIALRHHLLGTRIEDVEVYTESLREPLCQVELAEFTRHCQVAAIRRRAKFIIVELGDGKALILHLGMTGSCRIEAASALRRKHDHVCWQLSDGRSWRFNDPRKFGLVLACRLTASGGDPELLRHLGPEPLEAEFNAEYLQKCSRGRATPIKIFLLDQRIVAGIGNIYASEILFRAGVNPRRQARHISFQRYRIIVDKTSEVLREAINCGGTTIIDFKSVDGSEGRFHTCLQVYGRTGNPCPKCGGQGVIRKITQGGRSTFYCPGCQH